jgi:predicted metal-dependent HD superfamily phosphohydrolase
MRGFAWIAAKMSSAQLQSALLPLMPEKLRDDVASSDDVFSAYNEPLRHYHTLSHIQFMLTKLKEYEQKTTLSSEEIEILEYAIWFHDLVYQTQDVAIGSNETASALEFARFTKRAGLVHSPPGPA